MNAETLLEALKLQTSLINDMAAEASKTDVALLFAIQKCIFEAVRDRTLAANNTKRCLQRNGAFDPVSVLEPASPQSIKCSARAEADRARILLDDLASASGTLTGKEPEL